MTMRLKYLCLGAWTLVICLLLVVLVLKVPWFNRVKVALLGGHTVEQRIEQYGPAAWQRLGLERVPSRVLLVVFKDVRQMEVYVADESPWRLARRYPVLGLSGKLGPKTREGDRQVPEGFYPIVALNPDSAYHLALRVGYPNAEDLAQAKLDGRTELGGDIMIHGSTASIGCLAMGDAVSEELFVLAAKVGIEHINVLIAPVDFRQTSTVVLSEATPTWLAERYERVRRALPPVP